MVLVSGRFSHQIRQILHSLPLSLLTLHRANIRPVHKVLAAVLDVPDFILKSLAAQFLFGYGFEKSAYECRSTHSLEVSVVLRATCLL